MFSDDERDDIKDIKEAVKPEPIIPIKEEIPRDEKGAPLLLK